MNSSLKGPRSRGSASKVLKKVIICHYILLDTWLAQVKVTGLYKALHGKCLASGVRGGLLSNIYKQCYLKN